MLCAADDLLGLICHCMAEIEAEHAEMQESTYEMSMLNGTCNGNDEMEP